jgi:MFS family permease
LGQMFSMNMQQTVGVLLLKRLTNSPALVGLMSLANAIPMITLSLFGGVLADRVEKKFVLLFGQIAFALLSLSVAVALNTGYLSVAHNGSWWILIASSAIQGIIVGLAMPSRQAIINDIAPGPQLMNAISLSFMGMNATQLFAPTIAGFIVEGFNFTAVYYTMTFIFLVAIVFFTLMPRVGIKAISRDNPINEIKKGLGYTWHNPTIRLVLSLSIIGVVLTMPYTALMPFFTDNILHAGAGGYGIMMSVAGAGAIAASTTLASFPARKRGNILLLSGFFLGISLLCFAFSKSWTLSLCIIAIVGVSGTARMTITNTLIQHHVDDNFRGRVMSLFMMQFGLSNFGTFISGMLAEWIGVQWAIGGFAITWVVVSILTIIFIPQLRKLE